MPRQKSRYVPSLDGLRAFAVLAVIAYHMHLGFAPGGLLGVTMFFVLSGYLITGLLISEIEANGTVDLKAFWIRRIKRIVPAVLFAIAGTAALCTLLNHALLTKMRPDILPTVFFFNNWWQIIHNVSYFDALGAPSPLAHTWSLAIEEQFYLIWPVVLMLIVHRGARKGSIAKGCAIAALVSVALMAALFDPASDPSRVYYGTDTRAFSLLIGAILAFVWPYQKLDDNAGAAMSRSERLALDAVGGAALLGLVLLVALSNGFSPFIYRGGLLLCSVLTALFIACIVHPGSLIGRAFSLKPLVWVGQRSYSMYLWHFPILLLLEPPHVNEGAPLYLMAIELAAIFAFAHFSYEYVENPLRRGAAEKLVAQLRTGATSIVEWCRSHVKTVSASAVTLLIAVAGLAFVPDTNALEGGSLLKLAEDQGGIVAGESLNSRTDADDSASASHAAENSSGFYVAAIDDSKYDILMIGDSVSVRAIPYFQDAFPHGLIDAAVNRQFYNAGSYYNRYRDAGTVGSIVVIALGTNGYVTDDQIAGLMNDVGTDKMVWLVNSRSNTDWMESSNKALADAAQKYPNVRMIDWYAASADHGDYFDGDGTHLSEKGSATYIELIRSAVADYLPQRGDAEQSAPSQMA